MLRGFDGRIRGAEPELLIGIEPEVTGKVENLAEAQLPGQTLAVHRSMVWSHHLAHSQRGNRSTA